MYEKWSCERRASMQRIHLHGADLEYEVQGSGEPLLLIHSSILADGFFPLRAEPRLAHHYRVISYHRRGFAGSSRASTPFTIAQQAADGRALLRHLGIPPRRMSLATPMGPLSRSSGHATLPPRYRVWPSLSHPSSLRFLPGPRSGKASHPSARPCMNLGTKQERPMPSSRAWLERIIVRSLKHSCLLGPLSWRSPISIPFSKSNCRPCSSGV